MNKQFLIWIWIWILDESNSKIKLYILNLVELERTIELKWEFQYLVHS